MGIVCSNLDCLIAPPLVQVPGTVSHRLAQLAEYRGEAPCAPATGLLASLAPPAAAQSVTVHALPMGNPRARYAELQVERADGGIVSARCIAPASSAPGSPAPVVLMFHDAGRPVRGWHHMTRFIALGMGVVALEAPAADAPLFEGWERGASGTVLARALSGALTLATALRLLPWTDPSRVYAWGEGLGGYLALAVAASGAADVAALAMANPGPADIRATAPLADPGTPLAAAAQAARAAAGERAPELDAVLDALDAAGMAPAVGCRTLLGCGLMDGTAPAPGQFAVANRIAGPAELTVYPKFAHERINAFEDEVLVFLDESRDARAARGADA